MDIAVFETILQQALANSDKDAALNYVASHLELTDAYLKDKKQLKTMVSTAICTFYQNPKYEGNETLLRFFPILAAVSKNLGSVGICNQLEEDGHYRHSVKFHRMWAEAHAEAKDEEKFKHIWQLAKQRLSNQQSVDVIFRELARLHFPHLTDDVEEQTVAVFGVRGKGRRRSVAQLEMAAMPSAPVAPPKGGLHFGYMKNPLRPCLLDREADGYLGVSIEEFMFARIQDVQDVVDMDMSVDCPPRETRKRKVSPSTAGCRSPLAVAPPPPAPRAPSTLTTHSFSENFYSRAISVFSDTVHIEDAQKEDERDETLKPEPPTTAKTTEQLEFDVFQDNNVSIAEKENVDDKRRMSIRPPLRLMVPPASPIFEDEEQTVAGMNRPGAGSGIVTSTPAGDFPGERRSIEDVFFEPNYDDDPFEKVKGTTFNNRRKSLLPPKPVDSGAASHPLEAGMGGLSLSDGTPSPVPDEPLNPWDRSIRSRIMSTVRPPINQHELNMKLSSIKKGSRLELSGEEYLVGEFIAQGNFAKVFHCSDENNRRLALKYEEPSCEWEVYILEIVKKRLGRENPILNSIMQVTDAYILPTCSLILSEYLPFGTLLDLSNRMPDPNWMIVVFLAMNMARVYEQIHAAGIIHADGKPDNWLVLGRLPEHCDMQQLLDMQVIRLIDWGRAIDMHSLGEDRTFTGKAGTKNFDCCEMLDGRPWNYQCDIFAFVANVHVLTLQKYMEVQKVADRYAPVASFKRRLESGPLWREMFDELLNITDSQHLPSWAELITRMQGFFSENFDNVAWKNAVRRFNESLPA